MTVYCMPEHADCNFSVFQDCTFAVCRISDARLDGTSIYGGEFHSCVIKDTIFFCASLADTHFMTAPSTAYRFKKAYLRRCNVLDCGLYSVNFLNTTLDGCSFGRVESRLIRNLHTATITQGGATEAECRQNRESIYKALRPEPPVQEADRRTPAPGSRGAPLQKQSFKNAWPVWAALAVPVLYLAAVAAYAYAPGMTVFDLMERFSAQLNHPLAVRWTAYTPCFLLGALALYAATIALYYSTRQNRRPGVEHGSAAWGDVRALDRKYRDRKHPDRNVILTQHLQMGLNGKQHRRNLLQIIVGGSGAGKTRFLVKPNVMLANASYICTDPKGEIVRAVGPLLLKRGYVLRVFDLVDPPIRTATTHSATSERTRTCSG